MNGPEKKVNDFLKITIIFCVHFLVINVFVYIPAAAVSFFLRLMIYFDYRFDFDVSNSCNLIILYHET